MLLNALRIYSVYAGLSEKSEFSLDSHTARFRSGYPCCRTFRVSPFDPLRTFAGLKVRWQRATAPDRHSTEHSRPLAAPMLIDQMASMNFDDQIRRYFGISNLAEVPPKLSTPASST